MAEEAVREFRTYQASVASSRERLYLEAEKGLVLSEAFPVDRQVLLIAGEAQRAFAYEGEAANADRYYAAGREFGRRCLRANGAWQVMEELAGGRITAAGLRRFEATDLPCLRMLLTNWIRWVESVGHAGTVDLRAIGLLAERVLELGEDGRRSWRDHWAMGMSIGLDPAAGERISDAEFHFLKAAEMEPTLATPVIDRLSSFVFQGMASDLVREELRGMGAKNYATHASSQWGLQNQRALKRAIELLARLREN